MKRTRATAGDQRPEERGGGKAPHPKRDASVVRKRLGSGGEKGFPKETRSPKAHSRQRDLKTGGKGTNNEGGTTRGMKP